MFCCSFSLVLYFFFFKQKTAYEMRISDWSSDVCSSDLKVRLQGVELVTGLDLSRRWRLSANYTYLDARDRTTGERLPDRSRHRATATLEWAAMEALTTRLRAEYTGAKFRSETEADRPGYTLVLWYLSSDKRTGGK